MSTIRNNFDSNLKEHLDAFGLLIELYPNIEKAIDLITESISNGGKILIMGNGGSAADAQHFAAELVGRFMVDRKALPAIALTTDTSILTAVSNDFGFETIFERQVQALARNNDILIGISTSGNSNNIFRAFDYAKLNLSEVIKISLTGKSGGKLKNFSDLILNVPSENTPIIQECHQFIYHFICREVENNFLDF